jgi:ribosome biogenesis protein Nip4
MKIKQTTIDTFSDFPQSTTRNYVRKYVTMEVHTYVQVIYTKQPHVYEIYVLKWELTKLFF